MSTTMVEMLRQVLIFSFSIRAAATLRSQRVMTTRVPPAYSVEFMQDCMPVTWNIGTDTRWMQLCWVLTQAAPYTVVAMTLWWV